MIKQYVSILRDVSNPKSKFAELTDLGRDQLSKIANGKRQIIPYWNSTLTRTSDTDPQTITDYSPLQKSNIGFYDDDYVLRQCRELKGNLS